MKKEYPKTVMIKGGISVAIGVALLFFVALIFFNIHHSSRHKTESKLASTQLKVAWTAPPNWYQKLAVRKPSSIKTKTSQKLLPNSTIAPKQSGINQPQEKANQAPVEDMQKVMSAPISSNQINIEAAARPQKKALSPPPASNNEIQAGKDDQNLQTEKKAFLSFHNIADKDYLQQSLKNPASPYELKAGTLIPAILITGINSDLPGQITAQVRSNVYDTVAGKYILVPQGAKLTGLYDSQIAYGQSRVLVVWQRIIYPNGQSIDLEGMPGIDLSGYAGFHDQVNNHYIKIFGSVILMSVISAGAQLSQPQQQINDNSQLSVNQTLAASLGTNIMNTANMITQKNLGIQPTLMIRPGYLMNISVTKDIVFSGAYDEPWYR